MKYKSDNEINEEFDEDFSLHGGIRINKFPEDYKSFISTLRKNDLEVVIYEVMKGIGNLAGEQMNNEKGELFVKYIDVRNSIANSLASLSNNT